jgi:hypothetical protein
MLPDLALGRRHPHERHTMAGPLPALRSGAVGACSPSAPQTPAVARLGGTRLLSSTDSTASLWADAAV